MVMISFTFDEDGSSTSGNDNNGGDNDGDTQDFPSVGDTYQGWYVLAVTVEDDEQSALASLGVGGISDWMVPTKAQMDAFAAARNDVAPAPAAVNYLYKNGGAKVRISKQCLTGENFLLSADDVHATLRGVDALTL